MPLHARIPVAVSACASTLLFAAAVSAQSPVTLSFRALTEGGQPVRDLKPADLAVKLDGKPREVRSLELITAGAKPAGPVPSRPAFGINTAADRGRELIFVIDEESIAPGRESAVQVALRQIAGRLSAADRIGVLSLRSGGTSIAATTDRARIAAAIDSFRGQAAITEDLTCRTGQTLQSMRGLLTTATDAKTTLVLVSTGIAPIPNEAARTTLGRSSGLCQLRASDWSDVGTAAKGSPAATYVLFPSDGRETPNSDALAGLESLAGAIGAPVIRLSGTTAASVDRIADETAAYYVAAIDVEPAERNGAPHKTEVRVTRGGVRTFAGGTVFLAKAGGMSPKDMLRSPDGFRDLPLRATGWAMREGGSKLKIIALFEPAEPNTKLTAAMIALIDGSKIAAQWTAQSAELDRSPTVAALLAPAGNYRLRVAATDASGRSGAVDYPLQAQLTSGTPVTMSGLALGVPDNGFKPRVQFSADDQAAMGYLELYGVPKGAQVSGSIELAPSEDAPAIGTTPATVQPATADDMRIVAGGFSIGSLQPGDYVMRMIISLDGKVVGTVSRTLSKAGK